MFCSLMSAALIAATGMKWFVVNEDNEIRNCRISRGNAVLGIGSELSGGVRNVWMHDCVFDGFGGSFLQIKTNERRGGFIENIRVEDCESSGVLLDSVLDISTDCFYQWKSFPTREVRVTAIRDVAMRNVRAFRARRVLKAQGDSRLPIAGLRVEKVCATYVAESNVVNNVMNERGDKFSR